MKGVRSKLEEFQGHETDMESLLPKAQNAKYCQELYIMFYIVGSIYELNGNSF